MAQGIVDWEDLDIFFDEDEFAVKATLTFQSSGNTLDLKGIFDTPDQQRDFGGFVVDADDPTFTCPWQDEFMDVRPGDALTIGTEIFYIESGARSDGTGLASFVLARESTQDDMGDSPPTEHTAPTGGGLFSPNPGRS